MTFWAHLLLACLFVVAPMAALHWAYGLLATFIVLAAVEIAHGFFDDLIFGID